MKIVMKVFFIFLFFHLDAMASSSQNLLINLKSMSSMQANFRQEMFDANGKKIEIAQGKMAILKPGKFYWEVKKPQATLILEDGKQIWTYHPDLKQVIIRAQKDQDRSDPAYFLSGEIGSLLRHFHINQIGDHFILKPSHPGIDCKEIQLLFKGQKLQALRFVDPLNQTTDIYFEKIQFNKPINPKLFQFSLPKGVDLVQS